MTCIRHFTDEDLSERLYIPLSMHNSVLHCAHSPYTVKYVQIVNNRPHRSFLCFFSGRNKIHLNPVRSGKIVDKKSESNDMQII